MTIAGYIRSKIKEATGCDASAGERSNALRLPRDWLVRACAPQGLTRGLKHAGRMWPARTFCSPRDALGEFSNIQHLGVTKFTHRCLKVFGQQVNNFLSNERRDG